jgi:hypothetical protein
VERRPCRDGIAAVRLPTSSSIFHLPTRVANKIAKRRTLPDAYLLLRSNRETVYIVKEPVRPLLIRKAWIHLLIQIIERRIRRDNVHPLPVGTAGLQY